MQTKGRSCLAGTVCNGGRIALLACTATLTACASDQPHWMDHAALVIRPSHRQAVLAFSFGAEAPPEPGAMLAPRNVSAVIAAAVVVRDDPMPNLDTMDFKGGRLFIHRPKAR